MSRVKNDYISNRQIAIFPTVELPSHWRNYANLPKTDILEKNGLMTTIFDNQLSILKKKVRKKKEWFEEMEDPFVVWISNENVKNKSLMEMIHKRKKTHKKVVKDDRLSTTRSLKTSTSIQNTIVSKN